MWILIHLLKGYIFHFCTTVLGLHFFWLPWVWYPGESVFSILKYEYLGENGPKFENILTHWSVAQASSNDEKNWGSKISLDCPFNVCHLSFRFNYWNERIFLLNCAKYEMEEKNNDICYQGGLLTSYIYEHAFIKTLFCSSRIKQLFMVQ